ncbi:hypothetical protein BDV12DRAFT_199799 [Aspergillus spectabilis]
MFFHTEGWPWLIPTALAGREGLWGRVAEEIIFNEELMADLEAVEEAGGDPSGWPTPTWTPLRTTLLMQQTGTKTAILSATAPGACILTGPASYTLARSLNNYAVDLVAKSSTQSGFFASVWLDYCCNKLAARADSTYTRNAAEVVCRGAPWCSPQNYPDLYRDAAAAYANAIYWKVTGEIANGDAAAAILDAWNSTLTTVTGSSDKERLVQLNGFGKVVAVHGVELEGW